MRSVEPDGQLPGIIILTKEPSLKLMVYTQKRRRWLGSKKEFLGQNKTYRRVNLFSGLSQEFCLGLGF